MATKFHPELFPWPPPPGASDGDVATYRRKVVMIAARNVRRITTDCIAALFCLFFVVAVVPVASLTDHEVGVAVVVALMGVALVAALALIGRALRDLTDLDHQLTETR